MTGLSMVSSEAFQVQNYGIGGHQDLHWDFLTKKLRENTTIIQGPLRIASVLFYVSLIF